MSKGSDFSRQIIRWTSAVVLSIIAIVLISTYVFYALLIQWVPSLFADVDPMSLPTWPEWIYMATITVVGLVFGIAAARKLARRILIPLNSIADSVRRIAEGDLSARAVAGDRTLGETAALVDDFNSMAERLQSTAHELTTWNAAIAHELRTPLTILRGRLQGMADGVFPPEEAQFRNLLNQVDGLTRLVEDLRVLSLADGAYLSLRLEDVDIASEVSQVLELMTPSLTAAGFYLDMKVESTVIVCDPSRMRQVIVALLENARRYASPGKLLIESRLSQNAFHLTVTDEGPGIPEHLIPFIFEAFQRGDDSRSRESGGSGLGLAVVRAIAQAHKGQVSYAQHADGGSVFQITLPRVH